MNFKVSLSFIVHDYWEFGCKHISHNTTRDSEDNNNRQSELNEWEREKSNLNGNFNINRVGFSALGIQSCRTYGTFFLLYSKEIQFSILKMLISDLPAKSLAYIGNNKKNHFDSCESSHVIIRERKWTTRIMYRQWVAGFDYLQFLSLI